MSPLLRMITEIKELKKINTYVEHTSLLLWMIAEIKEIKELKVIEKINTNIQLIILRLWMIVENKEFNKH